MTKGRRGGVIGAKLKRMPLIVTNGLLVLIPAAVFLNAVELFGCTGNFVVIDPVTRFPV